MFVPSKPCRTVHDFRGENLSVFNNILYWAHECVPYVVHLPASSFGIHVAHLLEALQVVNHVQAFASLLCEPGYLGATENIQYNFWLHYGWLCCVFADQDEDSLLLAEPADTYDGDLKQWFWETHMQGSPFSCADFASDVLSRLETKGSQKRQKHGL